MKTERLYYTDAYRTAFDAQVVACAPCAASTPDAPPRYAVELSSSAFYPTSGGQPFDTGTLGGARVLDVLDEDDGRVVHVIDRPLEPGTVVAGAVDWARRLEHMQQHTGQHVLSAAFDRLFSNRTESFHLGTDSCSIDLAREVSADDVARAIDEANRIVWEDRPVTVRFVSDQEAASLPLRKEPVRETCVPPHADRSTSCTSMSRSLPPRAGPFRRGSFAASSAVAKEIVTGRSSQTIRFASCSAAAMLFAGTSRGRSIVADSAPR